VTDDASTTRSLSDDDIRQQHERAQAAVTAVAFWSECDAAERAARERLDFATSSDDDVQAHEDMQGFATQAAIQAREALANVFALDPPLSPFSTMALLGSIAHVINQRQDAAAAERWHTALLAMGDVLAADAS
jgi:hypothetical protein